MSILVKLKLIGGPVEKAWRDSLFRESTMLMRRHPVAGTLLFVALFAAWLPGIAPAQAPRLFSFAGTSQAIPTARITLRYPRTEITQAVYDPSYSPGTILAGYTVPVVEARDTTAIVDVSVPA